MAPTSAKGGPKNEYRYQKFAEARGVIQPCEPRPEMPISTALRADDKEHEKRTSRKDRFSRRKRNRA